MYMLNRRVILASTAIGLCSPLTHASSSLSDTLRIAVPFPAGGALDGMARQFADAYRRATGRNCIVDNKPGAATIIAASEVSRAKPDGSTLLWTTGGHLTNAVLMKKLPYDPLGGFTPLTMVYSENGFAMLYRANGPFKTVNDVIEAARREPGKLTYASAGNGNTTHIVGALFAKNLGLDMVHVPYKGTPLMDIISGVVDIAFIAPSSVMQYIESGRLKALVMSGTKRSPMLPNVPSMTDLGLPSIEVSAWLGLLAPPGTPADVLTALYDGTTNALADTQFRYAMQQRGNQVEGMPPDQFKALMEREYKRYKQILPPLGIQMDI